MSVDLLDFDCYRKRIQVMDLDYLEMHLMNSCNLKCRGCSHFSNIATDEDIESVDSFGKNIERLSKVQPVIYKIRLLGGEPFLNPQIAEYCEIVRRFYPYTDIHIVSNGLLLIRIEDVILKKIADLKIAIDISVYPPTEKILSEIVDRLNKYGIKCETTPKIVEFRKRMDLKGNANPKKSYDTCVSKQCHFYNNGFLSACPAPYVIKHYCQYFGVNIGLTDEDRISIWKEDLTSEMVVKKMNSVMEICRLCKEPEVFEWEAGKKAMLEDWLIDSR